MRRAPRAGRAPRQSRSQRRAGAGHAGRLGIPGAPSRASRASAPARGSTPRAGWNRPTARALESSCRYRQTGTSRRQAAMPGSVVSARRYCAPAAPAGSATSCDIPWHLCMLRARLPISAYVRPSSGSYPPRLTVVSAGSGSTLNRKPGGPDPETERKPGLEVELRRLPRPQARGDLLRKPRRVSGGGERLARQDRRRLMMLPAVLSLRAHRGDHVGAHGADDAHDVAQHLLAAPPRERLLPAERVPEIHRAGEVLLGAVEAVRGQQLLGPQHGQGVEQLGANLVLSAIAARSREEGGRGGPHLSKAAPAARCSRRPDAL